MAIRNAAPERFVIAGLSDTLDGSDVFTGACSRLQNFVKDVRSEGIWVPRPAAQQLTAFPGFTTPGFISAAYIIGTRVYGLLATGRVPGYDEPFCYDVNSNTFIPITGVTALNVPASPATSGPWTPPTMALVGTKLVVTHPGFSTAAGNYFGWFETSDPTHLSWSAGNTTGNPLPAKPVAVAQFGQRAWFLVNPSVGQPGAYYTDVLTLSITAGTQVLTFGDNIPVTAAVGLPLENQLGGIVQALIVFKDASNMYQITGDPALSTLTLNAMNVATGTKAPRSIAVTSKGVMFMSPDGIRVIDFSARISDPIGKNGAGVNNPFVNALSPARVAAAANLSTYRITVQDGSAAGTPTYEYWYDLAGSFWSGPHTFLSDIALPYAGTFVSAPRNLPGTLWQSDVANTSLSSFTENGAQLSCRITTSLLPDNKAMAESCLSEMSVELTLPTAPYNMAFTVLDEQGAAIVPGITLTSTGAASYWGSAVWGTSLWLGASASLTATLIPWADVIVFKRMRLDIQATASGNMKVGAINGRIQTLGYTQQ
jgi:hypothetical protein